MDKQTLMLELKGLSRVVSGDVQHLVYKRQAVNDLADSYEPINPFGEMVHGIETDLIHAIDRSIHNNLSREEGNAFAAQWYQMSAYQQMRYLEDYVQGRLQ